MTAVAEARDRKARLAQALKQNLKRRKASPAAGTCHANESPLPDVPSPGSAAGTQKAQSPSPVESPKTASKRN